MERQAMATVPIPYENVARFVAPLWPQVVSDRHDLTRENADQLLPPLIHLLDALFKAENLHRRKHFLPFEGKSFFGGEPASLLGCSGAFLLTFPSQVFPFSKTERQTFSFVMENLVDYFRAQDAPASKDAKTLFADHRFWIDNFAKLLDGKIASALLQFQDEGGESGEWQYQNESLTLPLAPFLIQHQGAPHFLVSGIDREWRYLDPWNGTEAQVAP
ncbi:MAG TPA: hypothetical protein PKK12_13545, partial [Candidatus Aminicenantes bacterium]|nr:hypothetical protein [Candidatus Aminicenantes bacterium]